MIVVHMGGGASIGAIAAAALWTSTTGLTAKARSRPNAAAPSPPAPCPPLFLGKFSHEAVKKMLVGHGGLYAYLGTNDCREIEQRIRHGDAKAREIYEAMAYKIGKWVGASAAVLSGRVKAVVITGGMSKSRLLVGMIRKYAGFVAPFIVCPATGEMAALSAQAAMSGKIKIKARRWSPTLRSSPLCGSTPG